MGHGTGSRPGLPADRVGAERKDRGRGRVGDARADAHPRDGLVRTVRPLVHVVPGLELAGVGLGEDVDPLEPLHRGDGVPVGYDEPERGAVIGSQRFAVHLVGEQDVRGRVGRLGQRQRTHEGQVVLVGLREDRLQVVRPVVGALEPDVDAISGWLDQGKHVAEPYAGPSCCRDGVVAPRLTRRQGPHLQPAVARALERDRLVVGRQRAEVLEREGGGAVHRTPDLQGAVMGRQREVAAHVVELGGRGVARQGSCRRLGVVGSGVDHLQCGSCRLEIVCDGHGSSPSFGGRGSDALRA